MTESDMMRLMMIFNTVMIVVMSFQLDKVWKAVKHFVY